MARNTPDFDLRGEIDRAVEQGMIDVDIITMRVIETIGADHDAAISALRQSVPAFVRNRNVKARMETYAALRDDREMREHPQRFSAPPITNRKQRRIKAASDERIKKLRAMIVTVHGDSKRLNDATLDDLEFLINRHRRDATAHSQTADRYQRYYDEIVAVGGKSCADIPDGRFLEAAGGTP